MLMLNESADIVIEIAIRESGTPVDTRPPSRPIVGPFRIRGHATIEAGYTVNYQMLLRNLNPDCRCVANVSIVSARPLNRQ